MCERRDLPRGRDGADKSNFFTYKGIECWCKESNTMTSSDQGAVSGSTNCGEY